MQGKSEGTFLPEIKVLCWIVDQGWRVEYSASSDAFTC